MKNFNAGALPIGKLDSEILQRAVIDQIEYKRPEVRVHSQIGVDCAAIDFGEYECLMSTDPITASVNDIGKLCINISANDIAASGVEPVGIMLTVLLPVGTTEEDIERMMADAAAAARSAGIEIMGGHTEITEAVNKPVIVSTAIGRGRKVQTATDIEIGDQVIMTKTAGIEGTAIIARDYAQDLAEALTPEELEHAQNLMREVSVVREGIIAGRIGTHGMHDITEGGVLGAVWEVCNIADVGVLLEEENIPIDPVSRKICEFYQIDILRLISSGSMLIIASPDSPIVAELRKAGIQTSIIGTIRPKEEGLYINHRIITPPVADELYKVVR